MTQGTRLNAQRSAQPLVATFADVCESEVGLLFVLSVVYRPGGLLDVASEGEGDSSRLRKRSASSQAWN